MFQVEPCASCGENTFGGGYSGLDLYVYPNADVCGDVTSTGNFEYYVEDRPNIFEIYDSTGPVLSTGWVGYADYAGPWGASLNTSLSGNIPYTFNSTTGRYVSVTAGPADPTNIITDSYEWVFLCDSGTTPTPTNTQTPTPTIFTATCKNYDLVISQTDIDNSNSTVIYVNYYNCANEFVTTNFIAGTFTDAICGCQLPNIPPFL